MRCRVRKEFLSTDFADKHRFEDRRVFDRITGSSRIEIHRVYPVILSKLFLVFLFSNLRPSAKSADNTLGSERGLRCDSPSPSLRRLRSFFLHPQVSFPLGLAKQT
jgi:hypothetical protein